MEQILLKAARVNAGYSQKQAAELLLTSKSTISRWETGETKIPEKMIEPIKLLYHLKDEIIITEKEKENATRDKN